MLAPFDASERRDIREAYGCGCGGERFDLHPLRIRRGNRGDDVVAARASCEAATGSDPGACPWAAMRDPFVAEVIRAHGWREAGELEVKYPSGVPNILVERIETYASAVSGVRVHDMREDRKRRQRELDERELQEASKRR